MIVHNCTDSTLDQVRLFKLLGMTTNKCRQRDIDLYQHPNDPDRVISVGTTFNGLETIVADEPKTDWETALDYAARLLQ